MEILIINKASTRGNDTSDINIDKNYNASRNNKNNGVPDLAQKSGYQGCIH